MERVSRYILGILAAAPLLGCRTPTQITVEITTEVPCDGPSTKANTTLSVGTLGDVLDAKPAVVVTSECKKIGDGKYRIGSLVVVPSGDKGAEVAIRVVTGINKEPGGCESDPKNCIIARRSLRFVPHTELYLPINLDPDCINVPCGTTTTCVAGQCVDARIADSSRCTTPDACDENALPKPAGGGDAGVDSGGDGGGDDGGLDGGVDGGVDGGGDGGGPGTWNPIKKAPVGRMEHVAAFVDGAMIVWGGTLSDISGYTNSGARYDPSLDAWTTIATSPLGPRHSYVAAAVSSTTMLVWGGLGMYTDGALYDAKADTWKKMAAFPLSTRQDVAWTYAAERGELILWGGEGSSGNLVDGARYTVATDTWTKMAAAPAVDPRSGATAVWNGKTVVIYGGGCSAGYCEDALEYDPGTTPGTDKWRVLPVPPFTHRRDVYGLRTGPTSNLSTFFGGGLFSGGEANADGLSWDGAKWVSIPAIPAPVLVAAARTFPTIWWDGRRIHVWGGASGGIQRTDGAAFDPATLAWTPLPAVGIAPREGGTVVWTGKSAIVFGGDGAGSTPEAPLADGAIFTP